VVAARKKDDGARAHEIVQALSAAHPDARFELDFETPLELLVALILAAQFRDDRVNQITPPLFARYRTAHDWAAADPAELEQQLRAVNFYRQKTKAVQRCCAELVSRFGGVVPESLDDLLTLPHVGRKTANVLRANAFGAPAIGVDRHVARLAQRIGFTRKTDPDEIEHDLTKAVRPEDRIRFCHLLQWHGRRVCLAREPRCAVCVIQPLCDFGRSSARTARSGAAGTRATTAGRKPATAKPRAGRTAPHTDAETGRAAVRRSEKPKPTRAQTGRSTSRPPR
jgi:endonuclease-3